MAVARFYDMKRLLYLFLQDRVQVTCAAHV
jgi:hypothetical protein